MERIKHFNFNRLSKTKMQVYQIPEHSIKPISESLPLIIKAAGCTHKELAKALNVSSQTITNYCDGSRRNPTPEFMIEIADFLNIMPSYFLEYRIHQLEKRFKFNPELVDVFLDLATTPKRIIDAWKEIEARREYYSDYKNKIDNENTYE